MRQIRVPGFMYYAVTENGEVVSLVSGRVLRAYKRGPGLASVNLYKNQKLKCVRIARLVYVLFIGPISRSERIVFKDGDYENYHYTNLSKETRPNLFKKGNIKNCKLTFLEVNQIRDSKLTYRELAKMYDRAPSSIKKIKDGTSYKHVPYQIPLFKESVSEHG